MKPDLSGKTAVLTGGGGVLISRFAYALAECGANVAVLDINYEAAAAAADQINNAMPARALAVQTNVLDKQSLLNARDQIESKLGVCDILVNGAGGNNPKGTTADEFYSTQSKDVKSFFELDEDGIRFVFDLNLIGVLLPTQVFAQGMADKTTDGDMSKQSVIINISSMNAFRPLTKIPAYSAAKAAVSNFTQWLAVYFAKSGIRVNAIAPGFFVTNQNYSLLYDENGNETARTKKILSATPMGRFGKPEELIGTLYWLVSNEASGFVTGVVVPVDGGFSAYSGV